MTGAVTMVHIYKLARAQTRFPKVNKEGFKVQSNVGGWEAQTNIDSDNVRGKRFLKKKKKKLVSLNISVA